ncbi:hypothetical protein QTP86_026805, partial [Hemibagrus guttatus]
GYGGWMEKDGGLRPCIDYRGLIQIAIKNWYPFPQYPLPLSSYRRLPLHQPTSSKKFVWNPEAQATFSQLKDHFISGPIFILCCPSELTRIIDSIHVPFSPVNCPCGKKL